MVGIRSKCVFRVDYQEFGILVGTGMLGQGKHAAGKNAAGGRAGTDFFIIGLQGFHIQLGRSFAVAALDEQTGIIVDLVVVLVMAAHDLGLHQQVAGRFFKIEGLQRVGVGMYLAAHQPLIHDLAIAHRGLIVRHIVQLCIAGQGRMGGIGIGQHQRMPAALMLEIIIDAEALHQAADKIEIAFPVLHAIRQHRIGRCQRAQIKVGDRVFFKDGLDDVERGLFLENTAVGGTRQEP